MVATVIALRIPQNLHLPRTLPVNGRAEHGPVCFGPVGTKKGKTPTGSARTQGYQGGSHSESAENSTGSAPLPGETHPG